MMMIYYNNGIITFYINLEKTSIFLFIYREKKGIQTNNYHQTSSPNRVSLGCNIEDIDSKKFNICLPPPFDTEHQALETGYKYVGSSLQGFSWGLVGSSVIVLG